MSAREDAQRHAFGATLLMLAGWEAAAFAHRVCTITHFSRRHRRWALPAWTCYFLLVLRHLGSRD